MDKRASILIVRKLRKFVLLLKSISGQIIKPNLTLYGFKLTIFGVYAVTDYAQFTKRREQLHRDISNVGISREVIIIIDLARIH